MCDRSISLTTLPPSIVDAYDYDGIAGKGAKGKGKGAATQNGKGAKAKQNGTKMNKPAAKLFEGSSKFKTGPAQYKFAKKAGAGTQNVRELGMNRLGRDKLLMQNLVLVGMPKGQHMFDVTWMEYAGTGTKTRMRTDSL